MAITDNRISGEFSNVVEGGGYDLKCVCRVPRFKMHPSWGDNKLMLPDMFNQGGDPVLVNGREVKTGQNSKNWLELYALNGFNSLYPYI